VKNLTRGCTVIAALMAVVACQTEQEGAGGAGGAGGEMAAASMAEPGTAEYKMHGAMSAAPEALANEATLMDWPATEGGEPILLREGTNGWTCFPDIPDTPAEDPFCGDQATLAWFEAWMTRSEPNITSPGIGYMLQGGGSPSNSDPFATEPAPGEDWLKEPPHLMLFPTKGMDLSAFPTDPENGGPWVMWKGTPYEHLMVPVG